MLPAWLAVGYLHKWTQHVLCESEQICTSNLGFPTVWEKGLKWNESSDVVAVNRSPSSAHHYLKLSYLPTSD